MWTALVAFNFLFTFICCSAGQTHCNNGDIRLTRTTSTDIGSYGTAGTVEICFNNQWGSICGSETNWTMTDAQVVCRQLGYSSKGAVPLTGAYYGTSSGPIHLSNLECTGTEKTLLGCSASPIGGTTECTHAQDVGVACEEIGFSCRNGDVRLASGSAPNEGRVEVCNGEGYGTICDDHWDTSDASVICHQLGYSRDGAIALGQSAYGPGVGNVTLTRVGCNGNEGNISQCSNTEGLSTCTHSEDASVVCKTTTPQCKDGEIRLANGRIPSEGRVEICYNGVWGTVCHDLWGDSDANVVCSQLGYSNTGAKAVRFADFGEGSGPIFLDNVRCTGDERYLNDCTSNPVGSHNCRHNKDAGVICKDPTFSCTNGHVRLVGGATSNEGRVEICHDDHYGTVCEDHWGHEEAQVVCEQLGYSREGSLAVKGSSQYGAGVGLILLDDVMCTGNEGNLLECPHRGVGRSNCYHHQDAAVVCKNTAPSSCKDGSVRLTNGTLPNEGRVEICINGVWSGVCDDGDWTTNDASVVCKQLNYTNGTSVAIPGGHYSLGQGPTLFSSIKCNGSEGNILACINSSLIGTESCHSNRHVGVICPAPPTTTCKNGEVRLANGGSTRRGRLEVCYNGVWGSVCDQEWSQTEASVVCKQLGYNLTQIRAIPVPGGIFGAGSGPVFLSGVQCYGVESNLMECSGSTVQYHTCPHSNGVGVLCMDLPCTQGDVRLVGGANKGEGHLEVCHDAQWYGVCPSQGKELSDSHAGQICSHLGYSNQNVITKSGLFRSSPPLQTLTLNDDCNHSNDIINCLKGAKVSTATQVSCPSNGLVGIACAPTTERKETTCTAGSVRLVGGRSPTEGRVELCVGGVWGTVCDDHWDSKSATVVCRQIGCTTTTVRAARAVYGGYFESGRGEIFLDNVRCHGNESNLIGCTSSGLRNHNCRHSEDAGVICEDGFLMSTQTTSPPPPSPPLSTDPHSTPTLTSITIGTSTTDGFLGTGVSTSTVIVPVASLVTASISVICLTVLAIMLFKWKKLKLLSKSQSLGNDIDSYRTSTSVAPGSPPPSGHV